jgi:hypothetical protein
MNYSNKIKKAGNPIIPDTGNQKGYFDIRPEMLSFAI